jgi:hypothetical protein
VAPFRVEPLDGLYQADVALLDQILEWQAIPTILLCDRDDEPEVLFDQLLAGLPVAIPCPPGELHLLLVGQQLALADAREITR